MEGQSYSKEGTRLQEGEQLSLCRTGKIYKTITAGYTLAVLIQ